MFAVVWKDSKNDYHGTTAVSGVWSLRTIEEVMDTIFRLWKDRYEKQEFYFIDFLGFSGFIEVWWSDPTAALGRGLRRFPGMELAAVAKEMRLSDTGCSLHCSWDDDNSSNSP